MSLINRKVTKFQQNSRGEDAHFIAQNSLERCPQALRAVRKQHFSVKSAVRKQHIVKNP